MSIREKGDLLVLDGQRERFARLALGVSYSALGLTTLLILGPVYGWMAQAFGLLVLLPGLGACLTAHATRLHLDRRAGTVALVHEGALHRSREEYPLAQVSALRVRRRPDREYKGSPLRSYDLEFSLPDGYTLVAPDMARSAEEGQRAAAFIGRSIEVIEAAGSPPSPAAPAPAPAAVPPAGPSASKPPRP